MIRSLYSSSAGMRAQQLSVDVIANNLANVNTAGFKRSQAQFRDLLYVTLRQPGAGSNDGNSGGMGLEIGSGSEVVATTKLFSPGVHEPTENELDIAIEGDGFFEVELLNGERAYTRNVLSGWTTRDVWSRPKATYCNLPSTSRTTRSESSSARMEPFPC